ncbi:MAG: type II secretion system protein [Patescibacteria group bacterium]
MLGKNINNRPRGFTLIELIIVVAIIGLLAAALFVAIDPAKRIGDANDAQRWSDITSILNAILTYTADSQTLPLAVQNMTIGMTYGTSGTMGCSAQPGGTALGNLLTSDFSDNLVPAYLATMPYDPTYSGATSSGYYIERKTGNRIMVGACEKYQTASMEVTR